MTVEMDDLEQGDWVDLRVLVTRVDEDTLTVRIAGQHVTLHKSSTGLVDLIKGSIEDTAFLRLRYCILGLAGSCAPFIPTAPLI